MWRLFLEHKTGKRGKDENEISRKRTSPPTSFPLTLSKEIRLKKKLCLVQETAHKKTVLLLNNSRSYFRLTMCYCG